MKDEPSGDPKSAPDASGAAEASPRRSSRMVSGSPIYDGWFIVLAGTLTAMLTNPGRT